MPNASVTAPLPISPEVEMNVKTATALVVGLGMGLALGHVAVPAGGFADGAPLTVQARPGETIDVVHARTIGANYGVLRVISSGSNWFGM
jgi:hypothetical protein